MPRHQLGKQVGPVPGLCPGLPAGNGFPALQLLEQPQPLAQQRHIVAQVGIVTQQVLQPDIGGRLHLHHRGGAHVPDQLQRHGQTANLRAFALDEYGPGQVHLADNRQQLCFKRLLAGLLHPGQAPQKGAFVAGQPFQIDDLRPLRLQSVQQPRLGAAGGPAHHAQPQLRHQLAQLFGNVVAVGFVASGQLLRIPPHQAQPGDHGAAAHPPAPAVDQRLPAGGPVGQGGVQMAGQIGRDQSGPQALGLERALLLVQGADGGPLLVAQHRAVDRPRNMVKGKFSR